MELYTHIFTIHLFNGFRIINAFKERMLQTYVKCMGTQQHVEHKDATYI